MASFGTYEGHRIHADAAGKMVDSASKGFQTIYDAMKAKKQMKQDQAQFDSTLTEQKRSALAVETETNRRNLATEGLEGQRIGISADTLAETKRSNLAGEEDVDNRLGFNFSQLDQSNQHFFANLEHEEQQQAARLSQDWDKFVKQDENQDLDRDELNNRFFANLSQEDEQFYTTHGLKVDSFLENQRQYNLMDDDRDKNTQANTTLKGVQSGQIIANTAGTLIDNKNKKLEYGKKKDGYTKESAINEFVDNTGQNIANTLNSIESGKITNEDGNLDTTSVSALFDNVSAMTAHQSRGALRRDLKAKYPNQNFKGEELDRMLSEQKGDNAEVLNQVRQKFNNMSAEEVSTFITNNPNEADKLRDWIGSTDGTWDKSLDLADFLTGGTGAGLSKADPMIAKSQGYGNNDKNGAELGATTNDSKVYFKSNAQGSAKDVRKRDLLVSALENMKDLDDDVWIKQSGNTYTLEVDETFLQGGNDTYKVEFKNEQGKEIPYINFNNQGSVKLSDLQTIDD